MYPRTNSAALTAPKGTNKIIVTTDFDTQANFNNTVNALLEANYEPTELNKEIFIIKTALKATGKVASDHYFFIRCRDNEIIITGQFRLGISVSLYGVKTEQTFEPIENKGMNGSILKENFNSMAAFARLLNGKITYVVDK